MKTLNRTLSLTLVFALVFSLMSFAFAADTTTTTPTGYTDAASITYKEAADVTTALGVFQGNGSNAFAPKDNLTREQAAKIICYLTMGKVAADGLKASSAPYTDVPADRWSAGSIAYCKQQGIIAGYGDGKFGPNDTVTGYQFGKMLLVALGYDASIEGFNGVDWSMNVAKRAFSNKLFAGNGNFNGNVAATREEAALYALNVMQTKLVTYANKGGEIVVGGVTVRQGASAPSQDGNTTFMATYCGGLVLDNGVAAMDAFGRSMRKWTFKGTVVGTYAFAADMTFNGKADGSSPAAQAAAMGISNYTVKDALTTGIDSLGNYVAKNLRSVNQIAALTANGRVVEIYLDDKVPTQINKVVVIDTVLTRISSINTAAKTVILVTLDNSRSFVVTGDNRNYATLSTMAVKDFVLASPDAEYKTVYAVAAPKTVSGALTKVDRDNNKTTGLTVAGTSYKAAGNQVNLDKLDYASVNANSNVTLILDSYGYAVYIANAMTGASQYFVPTGATQSVVDSHVVTTVTGYAVDGTKVSLNIGSTYAPFDSKDPHFFSFEPASAYAAATGAVYAVNKIVAVNDSTGNATLADGMSAYSAQAITRGQYQFLGKINNSKNFGLVPFAANVKFIYCNGNGVTVKDGVQNVAKADTAQGIYVKNPNDPTGSTYVVAAVLVNGVPDDAAGASVLYIASYTGTSIVDGHQVYTYNAYIDGTLTPISSVNPADSFGNFCYYSKDATTGVYSLSKVEGEDKSYENAVKCEKVISSIDAGYLLNFTAKEQLNAGNASIIDVGNTGIRTLSELNAAVVKNNVKVSIIYGHNVDRANFNVVASIFVQGVTPKTAMAYKINTLDTPVSDSSSADSGMYNVTAPSAANGGSTVNVTITIYKAVTSGTDTLILTGVNSADSVTFTKSDKDSKTLTFTMPSQDVPNLKVSVKHAAEVTYYRVLNGTVTGTAAKGVYTISADKSVCKEGDTVTVTVTPTTAVSDTTKDTLTPSVTGASPAALTFAKADGTTAQTFTFKMPAADVTVDLAGTNA